MVHHVLGGELKIGGGVSLPAVHEISPTLMDSLTVREANKLAHIFGSAAAELDAHSEHKSLLEAIGDALNASVEAHHAKL